MKKVTIQVNNTGLKLEKTPTWYMHWLSSIDKDEAITANQTINTLVEQGDIWFIQDEIINDGIGFKMSFIFDSEDAVSRWKEILGTFEKMSTIVNEEPNITEEDITFEQFAEFAANNEETEFMGLPEDF
jgi:hypothetical protein